MTPEQIQRFLGANLHRFDQSSQYLGDEPNSYRKDWDTAKVRMLLAASWPYFHAAGNQSIPAVYKTVNDAGPYLCDRWYLPETHRDMGILTKAGVPVFGIESKHQMADFDVVGTSISYTVLVMSFAKHLKMSGIPLRWSDRAADPSRWPMVMVGGQAYCAPGPLEVMADCVFLGEVEDEPGNGGLGQVLRCVEEFKATGLWQTNREECYRCLARNFRYLYFPRFVNITYQYVDKGLEKPSKQVAGYYGTLLDMRMPFLKRHVVDLNAIEPLDNPPLLYVDPNLGGGDVEAARGCTAWCSFCRLSWVQKPQRQRSVDYLVDYAQRLQRNVGSAELSPFGPDWPMVTNKKRVLAALLGKVNSEVDATAMRIDDFVADHQFILLQALGGMDSATLGLEGNSQRMRDLVGKGVSDAEVIEAVIAGIRAGLRKFKLFMITNLPGEDEGDILRIIRLAKKLADVRDQLGQPNVTIQFSWTPLLIEAQTPFQWFAPTTASHALMDVADYFRDLRIQFKIGVKANPAKVSFFQLCQRASREVGEAIVDVLDDLDTACWGGVPQDMPDRLAAALRNWGFHNGFGDCFDERGKGELFGWEFISTGVSRTLMWETFAQMLDFCEQTDSTTYDKQVGPDHRGQEWIARCDERCMGKACGVCSKDDLKLRAAYIAEAPQEATVDLASVIPVDQSTVAVQLRLRLDVPPRLGSVDNGHWRFALRRAAYRACEKLAGTVLPEGTTIAKRSLKFASDALKFRDRCSGTDYVTFGMTRPLDGSQVAVLVSELDAQLDPWLKISGYQIYPSSAKLPGSGWVLTQLEVDADPQVVQAKLAEWEAADYIRFVIKAEASYFALGSEEVNAKDLVRDIWAFPGQGEDAHRLYVAVLAEGRANPYALVAALLGKPSWLAVAHHPAQRLDWFVATQRGEADWLRPDCEQCGEPIPVTMLGEPYSYDLCMRCAHTLAGTVVTR